MATEKKCSSKYRQDYSRDVNEEVGYSYEEERIKSFRTWQVHFPVDPIRLAKAGFYYTGDEDEVACFSCHGHIKNWNYGDVVQKKHSELFPNCDFVNNRSKNIPLIQSKKANCTADLKQIAMVTDESVKLSHIMSTIDYNKMKSLTERLKTFAKWPLQSIDISTVATAGFFFLGFEDKVQCPFCKGIVSNWEAGDDPLKEHIKHFPWCNFLPDLFHDIGPKKDPWFLNNSEDLCGNMKKHEDPNLLKCKLLDKNQEHADLKKLGIHLHSSPVHPQQASLNARIRSFAAWPCLAPVSKEELAKAGFFYIGISDHTKCFHCNGGLCNWELGDDPWFEHARWFRNCDFLRLTKGENFIESVKKCHSTKCEFEVQSPYLWSEPLMILVDEAMRSELVNNVLKTDLFPHYVVRAAILRQIKETGTAFSSERELCLAVSYLKEEMENEPLKMNNYQASDLDVHNIDFKKCAISLDNEGNMKSNVNISAVSSLVIPSLNTKHMDHETSLQKDHCLCKICMDNEVGVVFLPCGHLLACVECAPALKLCPMCRKTIQATVRAYLP